MTTMEAILGRRSVRIFHPDKISPAKVEKLLDAARWAPTPAKLQLRRFAVVDSPELIQALAGATKEQPFIGFAPLVIVAMANIKEATAMIGEVGQCLATQEVAAGVQNMLLAAFEMGLGSCWVGQIDARKVAEIVNAPSELTPVALVAIGRAAEEPTSARLPVDQISWRVKPKRAPQLLQRAGVFFKAGDV